MPPRLIRLSSAFPRQPTPSIRISFISRYSTSAADEPVIKTQQVPAPGSGNIRVLLLNRPQARNALSRALLNDLSKHVSSIAAEGGTGPTRALVIGSNVDAAFCAGADLKERAKMTKEEYVDLPGHLLVTGWVARSTRTQKLTKQQNKRIPDQTSGHLP